MQPKAGRDGEPPTHEDGVLIPILWMRKLAERSRNLCRVTWLLPMEPTLAPSCLCSIHSSKKAQAPRGQSVQQPTTLSCLMRKDLFF